MNYYETLKVSRTASQQEIKDSYKKLIKQYHPDIYKGSTELAEKITKELNDAYTILSDVDRRRDYDLLLNSKEETVHYTPYTSKTEYEEPPKDTFQDMMKNRIHNIVDEKTSNMSPTAKKSLVIIIILVALLLTAITAQDYVYFLKANQAKREQELEEQREILEREYYNKHLEDELEETNNEIKLENTVLEGTTNSVTLTTNVTNTNTTN